jgi:hypothetical protein
MALMTVFTVAWSVLGGQGIGFSIDLVDRQAGTLLMGTLFAVALSRTMRRLQQVTQLQNVRAAEDVAALAALRVRDERLAWLEQTAAPALRSIIDGSAFDDGGGGGTGGAGGVVDRRAELLITEGMLRDSIRGGILAQEPMVSSTARARRRGVDVVLLDDSSGATLTSGTDASGDVAAALAWAAGRLDAVRAGAVTVRVSASESAVIVTVAGDEFGQETRQITARTNVSTTRDVGVESVAVGSPE